MFGSSLLPVVCRRARVLFTLFVFVHSSVQHILLCGFVFVLFVFVLCLVYPMLLVTLSCSFVITNLVFSIVYSSQLWPGWPFKNLWHGMFIFYFLPGSPGEARLSTLSTGHGYRAFSHILPAKITYILVYKYIFFQTDINI